METLDPNSSPNKRLKSETLTLESPFFPSSAKGKAPISDEISGEDDDGNQSPANLPPQNCGICFSDEGKSVRGLIDSCDHYFCFLCIIEWSKIESRCPLCRTRFSNIRRMRRDGSFIGQGSVRVPVRDQIYDPFGEPASDPYAQVKCTVCDGTADESLLLLCDLCDSALHTYCVGLGATVPEGDWYCQDCTLLRAEQRDGERDDNMDRSSVSKDDDVASSTSATVSIFDIVRDSEPDSSVDRLLKIISAPATSSSLIIASDQASTGSLHGSGGNLRSPVNAMESSARTLRNCRNVHRHISVLRDNWDAFRTGSLSFSSNSQDFSRKGRRKMNLDTSFPSTGTSQSKAQDTLCDAQPNEQPFNVDRAWKLMNIARSVQQFGPHKGASKTAHNKASGSKANNVASKDHKSPGVQMQRPSDKQNGRIGQKSERLQLTDIVPEDASTSRSKDSFASRFFSTGKVKTALEGDISHNRPGLQSPRKLQRGLSTGLDNGSACSMSLHEPIAGALNASCNNFRTKEISTCLQERVGNGNACLANEAREQSFAQGDISYDRGGLTSQQNSSLLSNEQKGSACSKSKCEPITGASGGFHVKLQGGEISKCLNEVGTQTASKSSKNDEAKEEIQSLVKLNLKLLSKDKRLGADAFKEIARISTHTILAACGYEHRKIIHSYQTLECPHVDQTQQLPRCSLMPSSCRECFYLFVKNVVSSIMSDKLNG